MKTLMIRFAFVFACLIPACGGRVGDGFDQSATTNVDDIGSDETTGGQQGAGGSSATTTAPSPTGGMTTIITTVIGGATSVGTTSTEGINGILRLHEPTAGSLPERTVLPGEKDITVFEFTLSAEQRTIRIPRMYVAVDGSIKDDELMPVTIVDEANNIVATENPTPFGNVYTFGEFGGAFWFTPFTVYESAPPKTFRVKTGIEPTAQIGKTFRFGIETSTSLCGNADDDYEVRSCPLAIYGNRFTVVENPNVNNGTGGAANNTATGGATSIGTGGTSSTGGSSTGIAGSPAISTGDAINTTGSNVVDTTLEIITPETACLKTRKIKLPDDAESNNNKAIGPFCCTGKTMTIRDRENNPIGYVYFYNFPQGSIIGCRSYAPMVDILVSAAPTYGSNDAQVKSEVRFTIDDMEQGVIKTASIGTLTYTLKITHADILIQGKTKLFDMETLRAEATVSLSEKATCPTLLVKVSPDTPKSKIVVPDTSPSGDTYSKYIVKNISDTPQRIGSFAVSGTISNFISINANLYTNDNASAQTAFSPNACILDEVGRCDLFRPNTSAHFTDNTPIVFTYTGGSDLPINPGEELQIRISGPLTAIQAADGPKSGDSIQLKITELTDQNGNRAQFEDPNEPPKMVLRKTAPTITFQPITDYLRIGKSKIASVIVSNASEVNALALQQLEFTIATNGVRYKQIRDEHDNPASVYVNGVVSPSSILFSDVSPTFGVVKFIDGDHLITKNAPITIDVYVNVEYSPNATWITTKLTNTWAFDSYTGPLQLVGLGSPGQIIAWKPDERLNPSESTMFWSDLSNSTEHIPFTGGFTSGDFFTGALVTGTDGSSIAIYP